MPVKGLMPGLMEVGKIKIGVKGKEVPTKDGKSTFRLPQKIDHFRIVKNERDENDDYIIDDYIIDIIKKNPATELDKDGNIVSIPIRLLYNEIDLIFPTQYVSYVGGKVSCSGNGEIAKTRDGRETKCPCERLNSDYTEKDKCKIFGTLSCIIEGGNVGSCYKFRTTSKNSARFILSSLMLIKAATGGLLSFIPLRLVISPKKTIIPITGATTIIYVVTVEYQGGVDALQQKALTMGQDRMNLIENMRDIEMEARKIVCNDIDSDKEEREFAEEFFPDTIEIEKSPEPKPKDKEPETKVDDLLGKAFDSKKESKKKPKAEKKAETKVEVLESDEVLPENVSDKKITRDQLIEILELKNSLGIKDQIEWTSLIKKNKFKDVKKANDMTAIQGDKFIEYLKNLVHQTKNDPF